MARKMMSREVTKTIVKVAKMEFVDGLPKAVELEPVVLLGNVSLEKAQKEVHKELGKDVTVYSVSAETLVYQLPLETFIEIATVVEEQESELVEA